MSTISRCPICDTQSFTPILKVKDYTVSRETFDILKCDHCSFLATSPIPDNLGRYYQSPNYISHSNQASGITDILYKFARSITLRWKINLIQYYNSDKAKTLLDYGCGTGTFLAHAKKAGWSINGVEPADKPREAAAALTQTQIAASLEQVPAQTKFSIITLWHVLEHVEQLNQMLASLTSKLENNGTIFIAVPNHNSYDARTYKEYWAAYDTPRHLWHFSHANMRSLMNRHGLTLHKIVPMKLDAFYVSILSEKYKGLNTHSGFSALLRGIIMGFKSNLSAVKDQEYSSLIYIARK